MKRGLFKIEYPNIYSKVDLAKNKHINFDILTSASSKILYLKCDNPSHNWHASVYDLTRQDKKKIEECFLCKRGLTESHPWITEVWDYEKNVDIPDFYTLHSHKKKFFKCLTCKRSYETIISNRIKCEKKKYGGCPYCTNLRVDEKNSFENCDIPILLKEFDHNKNVLTPDKLYIKSSKRVWWKCSLCNHSWCTAIVKRINGTGCPKCNNKQSRAEIITLHQINYIFGHAKKIKTDLNEIDIFIKKYNIGIEVDGAFHKERKIKDQIKNKGYENRGIKIFRLRDKSLGFNINDERDIVFDQRTLKKEDLDNLLILILQYIKVDDKSIKERINNFFKSSSFINEKELITKIQIDKKVPKNNLKKKRPDLIKEWDFGKNLILPEHYSINSNEKVWWKCEKKHSYQQTIYKKTKRNRKCPYCSNKIIIPGYNSCIDIIHDLYSYVENPFSVNLYKYGITSAKQVKWKVGKHSIYSFVKNFYNKIKLIPHIKLE